MKATTDEKIISGLLSCTTVRETAKSAGVSERTIYTRLKNPEFKQKLDEARREVWKGHATTLQGQLGKAIQTIVEIMDNEKTPPQVRLNASAEIIRSGMKMTEMVDVIDRLDTLETRLKEEA